MIRQTLSAMAVVAVGGLLLFGCALVYWQWIDYDRLFEDMEDPVLYLPTPGDHVPGQRPEGVVEWQAGQVAMIWRRLCHYRRPLDFGLIRRTFSNADGALIQLADAPVRTTHPRIGCYPRAFSVTIPPQLLPGVYVIGTTVVNERVNRIKRVTYTLRPVSIVILPSPILSVSDREQRRVTGLEREVVLLREAVNDLRRVINQYGLLLSDLKRPWYHRW